MNCAIRQGGPRELWSGNEPVDGVALAWLGQAGFALRGGGRRLVIDPYLSDSLAEKYRGRRYPHVRMMPPPIAPGELSDVDIVLCTHAHTDHMDAQTLEPIAQASPGARFVVPRAAVDVALQRGVPADRMTTIDVDETVAPTDDVQITAVPAAHERRELNDRGEHVYLGYIIRIAGLTIYHSGDTVPFDGLDEFLVGRGIDVALLPVNGRDEERASNGVPGNLTFDEAVALCRAARIATLVPHHFGMFEFNTVDPRWLESRIAALTGPPRFLIPAVDRQCVCTTARRRSAAQS